MLGSVRCPRFDAMISGPDQKRAGNLLTKICAKILKEPKNEKFRSLKLKTLTTKLGEWTLCIDLLENVGFQRTANGDPEGERLKFVDHGDLNKLQSLRQRILRIVKNEEDAMTMTVQQLVAMGYDEETAMVAVQHSDGDIMRALELLMRLQSEVPAEGIHKIKVTKPLTEREWLQKEERATVRRFKFIDAVYRKWVELKRGGGECDEDIYELIDSKLSEKYNVESFLNDFRFIVSTNRGALGYDELKEGDDGKEEDDDLECNVNDCFMVKRSERNRARMTRHDQKRKNLFFVSREMEEDGASRHSVVIQQILDTAHIWCCHTLRVKADQYIDGKLGDDDDDEKEVDWSCTDRLSQQFGALISKRRRARTGSGRH